MAVFQAMADIQVAYRYNYYNLLEGQLVAANDPELLRCLSKHSFFREITDDILIKLAPPLYMVKQVQNPDMMRKEDIIYELRSYGISVDPYMFSATLSMQLKIARKLQKRNFLTVLDEKGRPAYIDRVKLPVPASKKDLNLPEPEEPNGNFYKITEYNPDKVIEINEKELDKSLPENEAMRVTKAYDENEINVGKSFEKFCEDLNKHSEEQFKAKIEREQKEKEMLFKEQMRREDGKRLVSNTEIIGENFKFLIELKDGEFIHKEVSEEEKEEIRVLQPMRNYSSDVSEVYLNSKGIRLKYDANSGAKRSVIIRAMEEAFEKYPKFTREREWEIVCLNMLHRRYNEICDHEPDYRKMKGMHQLRKRSTSLTRYGLKVDYSNYETDYNKMLTYVMLIYQCAKLGIQVGLTEKENKEKMYKHRRRYGTRQFHEGDPDYTIATWHQARKDINNTEETTESEEQLADEV